MSGTRREGDCSGAFAVSERTRAAMPDLRLRCSLLIGQLRSEVTNDNVRSHS